LDYNYPHIFQHRFVPTLEREAELKFIALKRFPHRLWALVLVAGLLLAGCATSGSPTTPVAVEPGQGSAAPELVMGESLPAEAGSDDNPDVETDTPTKNSAPVESVSPEEDASLEEIATPVDQPAPRPTPRAELHASDPSSVTLAAGKPQLVEFFAFW
jgi:hypothetical protein